MTDEQVTKYFANKGWVGHDIFYSRNSELFDNIEELDFIVTSVRNVPDLYINPVKTITKLLKDFRYKNKLDKLLT